MKRLIIISISVLSLAAFALPVAALSDSRHSTMDEDLGSKLNERFEEEFYEGLGNKLNERFEEEFYEGLGNKGKETDPEYVGSQFRG